MTAADIDTRGPKRIRLPHRGAPGGREPPPGDRRVSSHRSSHHDCGQLVPGCGPEEDGYLVERPVVDWEVGGFDSARSFALRSSVLIVLSRSQPQRLKQRRKEV